MDIVDSSKPLDKHLMVGQQRALHEGWVREIQERVDDLRQTLKDEEARLLKARQQLVEWKQVEDAIKEKFKK